MEQGVTGQTLVAFGNALRELERPSGARSDRYKTVSTSEELGSNSTWDEENKCQITIPKMF